jgi:hypothetical protein
LPVEKSVRWAWIYLWKRRKNMAYTKPIVLAQNSKEGSFAAGCPARGPGGDTGYGDNATGCKNCERTK